MADRALLKSLLSDVEEWNRWWAQLNGKARRQADFYRADLTGEDLSGTDLSGADLTEVNLTEADLTRADLTRANLTRADLTGTDLTGADLTGADLTGANLTGTGLAEANLTGTNLAVANLTGTNLTGTNLTRAKTNSTTFADLDLRAVIGLGEMDHLYPSTVGVDTLFRTGPGISKVFLRGCGVPQLFTDYVDSLVVPAALGFYRTFLSHSTADEVFIDKLYSSLFHENGISTWLDKHQILPGDGLVESIDRGVINQTDKMVLVCSRASLSGDSSWWIDQEIERALERERSHQKRTGETLVYLIPISIDGFLFSDECTSPYTATLTSRHAAKFDGWDNDPEVYSAQLGRVLNALNVKPIRPGDFTTPRG